MIIVLARICDGIELKCRGCEMWRGSQAKQQGTWLDGQDDLGNEAIVPFYLPREFLNIHST